MPLYLTLPPADVSLQTFLGSHVDGEELLIRMKMTLPSSGFQFSWKDSWMDDDNKLVKRWVWLLQEPVVGTTADVLPNKCRKGEINLIS